MRKFSDWEKDIIREIANLAKSNTTFPVFILFKDLFIDREIFRYDSGPHHLLYNFTKVNQDELRKEERLLFDRLLLIEYLSNNRYIYIYMASPFNGNYGNQTDEKSFKFSCLSPSFVELVHKYMTNWMYVKKDLLELVENDFKEYEEIALEEAKKQTKEARKQTKSARWSVIISAIAVVVALLTMILSICL
jgi:hypothetical protein